MSPEVLLLEFLRLCCWIAWVSGDFSTGRFDERFVTQRVPGRRWNQLNTNIVEMLQEAAKDTLPHVAAQTRKTWTSAENLQLIDRARARTRMFGHRAEGIRLNKKMRASCKRVRRVWLNVFKDFTPQKPYSSAFFEI